MIQMGGILQCVGWSFGYGIDQDVGGWVYKICDLLLVVESLKNARRMTGQIGG